MRRDYFTIHVRDLDWIEDGGTPTKPSLVIDFEGPVSMLQERMTSDDADLLDAGDIDVSFRYLTPIDDPEGSGVLGITDRYTGEYLLELNADVEILRRFITAANAFGDAVGEKEHRYQIAIQIDEESLMTFDKRTLLIYNREGDLLRKHSLIPNGVEL